MKRWIKVIFATIMVLSLVSCKEEIAKVGGQAPALAVYNLQGKEVKLSDFPHKTILINFWSQSCGMCIVELQALQKFEQKYPNNVQVIAINTDGDKGDIPAVMKKRHLSLLVVKDQLKITAERYQLVGTPTSYIINPEGKILEKFQSIIPEDKLEKIFKG